MRAAPPIEASLPARAVVLIVDDCAGQRRALSAIITSLGWRAYGVASGEEAIAVCAQAQFDAVLMDLHMPGASGLEAARRLRAQRGWTRAAPIILATSAASAEVARRARAAGIDACVAKPARPAAIIAALRAAFAARAARAAA